MMRLIKNNKELLIKLMVIILILLALYFVISCNLRKTKVLVIEDNTNHQKFEYNLPNRNFSLGYTHSVLKTPVEEFFYINENNQIVLEKIVFESYGVGTPFLEEEGELEVVDGKFVLKIDRVLDNINMIISPIPNHWISISDNKYYFNDILDKPNSSIKISIYETLSIKSFSN